MERKVKDAEGLYRNSSGAIVNKDFSAYQNFIEQRKRLETQEKRINNIESELSEIKSLLVQLINKA